MTVKVGELLGGFIKRNFLLIILAAGLLLFLSILSAQSVQMATGIETMVSKDSQLYHDIDYYDHHFQGTSQESTFLVLITTDNVYDPAVLEAMALLDSQIRANPKVANVSGLYSFAGLLPPGTLGNAASLQRQIARLPQGLSQSMVLDPHHTIMAVRLLGDVEDDEKPPILQDVQNAIRWTPLPPGTSAIVTGSTAMMLEIQQEMRTNMVTMLVTAIVLMVIALWVTFSHSKWRLLPLPIVLVGVVYTAGVMGVTGVPITMVSMAVFPILIGLGVEYAIQFQNRMMEELTAGKAPGDAVVATVRGIGPPVTYSVLCTCLGFASVVTSPIPMISDFGLMCLIGVVVCFLTALFLLLSILVILTRRSSFTLKRQKTNFIELAIERVAETTTRHPGVIVVAVIAMLAGYLLDPTVGVEIDQSTFVPQDLPSVVQFRALTNTLGYKLGDMTIMVKAQDVTSPEAIRWMQRFSDYELSNNPDVVSVSSLAAALEARNNGTLPSSEKGLRDGVSALPPDELNGYVDDFRGTGVILMTINAADTPHLISMLQRVQKDLQLMQPPAGIQASLSGQQMVTLATMGSLQSDRLLMTLESGLLVFIGLLLIYRGDWVRAFVPVFAVIIVTGLSCIVMILLRMKYTPLSVTLGALTIGIGVDFSILHMERYYEEKAKGHPPRDAMRIATGKIGNAIFASASTVIAGFGALVMSNFSILSNFGLVTIIDFVMALCSAFVIMPPLLVTLDTWWTKVRGEAVPSRS